MCLGRVWGQVSYASSRKLGDTTEHCMCIAHSSLIWGCMLQAPRSTLNTLIQKAGLERRPGLKTRLMGQGSRSICHMPSHLDGSFGLPEVSWYLSYWVTGI